jgi:hypothetical protein
MAAKIHRSVVSFVIFYFLLAISLSLFNSTGDVELGLISRTDLTTSICINIVFALFIIHT